MDQHCNWSYHLKSRSSCAVLQFINSSLGTSNYIDVLSSVELKCLGKECLRVEPFLDYRVKDYLLLSWLGLPRWLCQLYLSCFELQGREVALVGILLVRPWPFARGLDSYGQSQYLLNKQIKLLRGYPCSWLWGWRLFFRLWNWGSEVPWLLDAIPRPISRWLH